MVPSNETTARRPRGWRVFFSLLTLAVVGIVIVTVGPLKVGTPTTTTTTIPPERAQPGWTVDSRSARGVMVDSKFVKVAGATFWVIRLRARSTLLRWHVGAGDPNAWRSVPADAGPSIAWSSEGRAGVVAAFTGGFKQSANAGGSVVDNVTLVPLVRGDMTVALNRFGHWEMGVWGRRNFPTPGFHAVTYRQNLAPLVENGKVTAAARSTDWYQWGSPINHAPLEPRTGLGVDAAGNLLYVGTMSPVWPRQVGGALVDSGARTGMQLDMNPFWPIAAVATKPLHHPSDLFSTQLPRSQHDVSVLAHGWSRDFFVAVAEPASWSCRWAAPKMPVTTGAVAQPLRLLGHACGLAPSRKAAG